MPKLKMLTIFLAAFALGPALAAAAGRYGGHTLEFGSRDSDFAADYLTMLQTDLSKLGYDDYLLTEDKLESAFGPSTGAAVKAFQQDYGLEPTGVVEAETAAAIERALAGAKPVSAEPPALTLLESAQITIKAGKKGKFKLKPESGKTYVLSGEGDVFECNVVNPYEAYAPVDPPPADVRLALKELGDEGKAVIFGDIPFAGDYYLEIEPINDLKDVSVTVRIYELTR